MFLNNGTYTNISVKAPENIAVSTFYVYNGAPQPSKDLIELPLPFVNCVYLRVYIIYVAILLFKAGAPSEKHWPITMQFELR
jgi:hypothetical protein